MLFPITFPYSFPVAYPYRRDYLVEVRTISGNLVRFVSNVLQSSIRDVINAPSILRISMPADDPGAAVIGGMNEIWITDQDDNIHGKYRIATRADSSAGNTTVALTALSYLSQLGEEWVLSMHEPTASLSSLLTTLLNFQQNEQPVTVGSIESVIGTTQHQIDVDSPQTILKILQDLEANLPFYSRFWVDDSRQLNWEKIEDQALSGRQFRLNKNMGSLRRRTRYDRQVSRMYAYGSERRGVPLRLGDQEPERTAGVITTERQRWRFRAVSATSDTITVQNTYSQHEDPQTIDGYDSNGAGLRTGDEVQIIQDNGRFVTREILSVAFGAPNSVITLRETIDTSKEISTPGTIYVARNFIDSSLRGGIWQKMIVVDHGIMPKDGTAYTLPVSEAADADIAARTADQADLTLLFVDDKGDALSHTVTVTNWTTGAFSGDVTIPNPSLAFDTVLFMVLAWSVY